MNEPRWTDQDIENLLESVEQTLEKAEQLAKSTPLKKDDGTEKPPETEMPPEDQPAPAGQAPEAPQDPAAQQDAPPADQPAPGAEEQPLSEEQDQPLSDEELSQIYGSMPPDELERHYAIIRQQLQSAYSQDDTQPQQAPEAQPPTAPAPAPEMEKSETIAALQKQIAEQGQALEHITKAFEVLAKPARKSITDLQHFTKSENDIGSAPAKMTAEQIKEAARKLSPANLTKTERDQINNFFLHGEAQNEVEKLINSKGGK